MSSKPPSTPAASYRMISVPEAQDLILQHTFRLQQQQVPLAEAVGCVLASDTQAMDNIPPYRASIKDGYAVRAAEGAGAYVVGFDALAGSAPGLLKEGLVAYIGTGGPVPEGADAVVQIEDTESLPADSGGQACVKVIKAAKAAGQDIRPVGSDIKAQDLVLKAGTLLGPGEIGILASVGAADVQVHRRPRVGVLSTGDELCEPSTSQLGPGQIRDANRAMLLAAASEAGAEVVDFGIARDRQEDVKAAFQRVKDSTMDVLLTSGGVSMGDKDFIKPLLEQSGQVHFGKVKMKPGKPLTFATLQVGSPTRQLLSFGLPGNPVSAIVTFHLAVVPCLRKMAGWQEPSLRRVHVKTTTPLRLDPVRPEYHRATLHYTPGSSTGGELLAVSTGGQISSRLLSMRSANALLELPAEDRTLPAGTVVSALVIADLQAMPLTESVSPLQPR